MNNYILRGKWDSKRRARDLNSLRKWLAGIFNESMSAGGLDVYQVNKDGRMRFVGRIGTYNGVPVWYTKLPAVVSNFKRINLKTGKLMR